MMTKYAALIEKFILLASEILGQKIDGTIPPIHLMNSVFIPEKFVCRQKFLATLIYRETEVQSLRVDCVFEGPYQSAYQLPKIEGLLLKMELS